MTVYVKNGGTWSGGADRVYINQSGTWQEAYEVWIKDAGIWKRTHLRRLSLTISTNQSSTYIIKDAATSAGWNGTDPIDVNLTINSGIVVSSSNTSFSAMRTGSSWPAGSQINVYNNGYIIGMGGKGADGGGVFAGYPISADPGSPGGTAFLAESAVSVYNYGTIAGGGGGGGAGQSVGIGNPSIFGGYSNINGGSGGGGGRTGNTNSAGGTGNSGAGTGTSGGNGTAGTFSAAGSGSTINRDGGAGGNWGTAGSSGQDSVGGAAGKYAEGNSLITWSVVGTRLGGVS